MWQRIFAILKQRVNLFQQWVAQRWTRQARPEPATPAKVEALASPTAIREPELGMAANVPPEYRQNKSLFSYRERVFFNTLIEEVGSDYAVFAKVRLADILWLANEPENRKYHSNQLLCKYFDFLLCEKGSYKPLLVIELDDSSHKKYEHHERDEFKDKVCKDTGLTLWRPRVQQTYPKGFVAGQVRDHIHAKAVR